MSTLSTGLSRDERRSKAARSKAAMLVDALAEIRSVGTTVACELIPCSIATLHKLIKDGEIESFLDGNQRRVTVRSIIARRDRLLAAGSKAFHKPPRGRGRPRKQPATTAAI
jgi:hypothetical protein